MIVFLDFLELVIATPPRFFLGLVAAGLRHRRLVRSPFLLLQCKLRVSREAAAAAAVAATRAAELKCAVTYEPLTSRKRRFTWATLKLHAPPSAWGAGRRGEIAFVGFLLVDWLLLGWFSESTLWNSKKLLLSYARRGGEEQLTKVI